jgi:hypothetical protein
VGKIPEYYKPDDDKLIFAKRLAGSVPDDRLVATDSAIQREILTEGTPQVR